MRAKSNQPKERLPRSFFIPCNVFYAVKQRFSQLGHQQFGNTFNSDHSDILSTDKDLKIWLERQAKNQRSVLSVHYFTNTLNVARCRCLIDYYFY